MPDLGCQRRVQLFAGRQPRIERVAVDAALVSLEAVRQVADRAATLAGRRKRRSRRGGCAVIGSLDSAPLQAKSLTSAACTFGATSSTRTG